MLCILLCGVLLANVYSTQGYRFVREHPAEVAEFKIKLLGWIVGACGMVSGVSFKSLMLPSLTLL